MKALTPSQVKSLNALASPKDSLEALWATRPDGSRGRVVKVTKTRVWFEDVHDCFIWSEPVFAFKAFHVLTLIQWLSS